jgi:hypothetical protein
MIPSRQIDYELNEFIHDIKNYVVNTHNIKLFYGENIVTMMYDKFIADDKGKCYYD